ncbi:MAG TPA: M23 family metallopeptidase [Aestuariivirgaceae bacterium]|nr:M23 family metallopeptidase [Aestuariivirgaceae bacterium]
MTRRLQAAHALASGWALMAIAAPLAALELVVPVDCKVGQGCFIQQYMDHDPSREARDYACGTATYDDHDGTDFRLRTTREAEQGVAVLAAAAGTVTAHRDGMADVLRRTPDDLRRISDRECGNGVVVDHGDGWETQYCHLKRGSLAVETGDDVEAGQTLGEIGYSGAASFPHVHLTVRQDGEAVDPFLGPDADPEACGTGAKPLWTSAALADLDYEPGRIIDIGFAPGPMELQALETGTVQETIPDRNSPAIVAWGWAVNLQDGDEIVVVLGGPDGGELARNSVTLDSSKAQRMLFAGTRPPAAGWPAGLYTATFTVSRAGAPAMSDQRELLIE